MSAFPVETMVPDPAATSLPNSETTETQGTDLAKTEVEVKEGAETSIATEEESKPEITQPLSENRVQRAKQELAARKPRERTYENGVLKTSAQQIEGKNNSRYDPSVLPVSSDSIAIRSQVEFYFGDTNLKTDAHMLDLTGGAANKPVDVKEICKFGRMKRFQPQSAVVEALKASKFLEIIGEEGQEQIKRKHAFDPTIPQNKAEAQSVYVKGFGDEEPSSQFDIEAFFAPYGPTNEVRLRRTDNKLFKGSVFVEFVDEETAKKFLTLEPKPLWQGKHKLDIESKTSYVERKAKDIRDGNVVAKAHRGNSNHRGTNRGRGRGDRKGNDRGNRKNNDRGGDRDPNDWKKRREDDRASGFKDNNRGGRGDRRGNNRGGRDRGPRNDRNREREEKSKDAKSDSNGAEIVKVAEVKVESPKNEKKRAREDDNTEQAPAKKLDTKSEIAA